MSWIPVALGLWIIGGLAALAFWRRPQASAWASALTLAGGTMICLPAIWRALAGFSPGILRIRWGVPGGEFALQIDALAAWFLLPTLVLSVLAAVYGVGYLSREAAHRPTGPSWFFFNLLVASMAVVLMARNAVLFLTAWEIMALASFFLVTFEDERESVRRAGWTYLIATHLGTAFLLTLFILLGRNTGSLDFGVWAQAGGIDPRSASLLFVLALVGFGSKAGMIPFHVWLPEAHPAAPSHVSAVMSGVMIKTGIYGLLRSLTFLGEPPSWWGWLLIGLGIASGILGVLFALAQHDLKRLLAYHSVENIGIILLGLGLGVLGSSLGSPVLAMLGFAGCLLHVLNHALFKGLLFLGAGSVLRSTGSRDIEHLGGLLKRMPWTALTFLVGAAAISGLPPLNGFVSEMLVFLGGFRAIGDAEVTAVLAGAAAVAGLALISGLAIACFTKAFGIVFLGEPRTECAGGAKEAPRTMLIPMGILAASCIGVGLAAPWIVGAVAPILVLTTGMPRTPMTDGLAVVSGALGKATLGGLLLITAVGLLALLRRRLLRDRSVETAGTWDCGYARPTTRMQYTASSFAQPIVEAFKGLLGTRTRVVLSSSPFPDTASFSSETPDPWLERFYRPAFSGIGVLASKLRWMQHGNIHLYVLYIALALLAMLVWMMG